MPKGDHRLKIDIGSVFGDLTVKSEAPKRGYKRHFVCECVCGHVGDVSLSHLKHGGVSSCRECSLRRNKAPVTPGDVYGQLTVIEELPEEFTFKPGLKRPRRHRRYLKCKCSCGRQITTPLHSVLTTENPKCYMCGRKSTIKYSLEERNARNVFGAYRKGAENRNIDFLLSFEEFCVIVVKPCAYCGKIYTNKKESNPKKYGGVADTFYYSGVDRVDSSKAYEVGNCVPCCRVCNVMKMALPTDVFLNNVKDIYKFLYAEKVEILPELEKDTYDDK